MNIRFLECAWHEMPDACVYADSAGRIRGRVFRGTMGEWAASANEELLGKYIDEESAKAAIEYAMSAWTQK